MTHRNKSPLLQIPEQRSKVFGLVWRSIGLTLFNNFVLALPATFGNYSLAKRMGHESSLETFPSTFTLVWQLLAFMMVSEST